jgi:short-subunit dehydrogenase
MKTRTLFGAAAAAALAGAAARRPAEDITGEVAVITGASRGLGLILARELARHGCRLVICARDSDELGHAASMLRRDGAEVTAIPADIEEAGIPELLVRTAVQEYGRLDIVINNAGIIQVGPAENVGPHNYEEAVRLMALAPVRLTYAALPVMREQQHGRIVNITSVGGKVSVPHLLPYCVGKFAAVGFSEGLRAELGAAPIAVTTVVPGLMRTGSHLHAEFTGRREDEFTWFSLGASAPLVAIDAERAGQQIVSAMRRRRAELIITPLGQVAARSAAVVPELTSPLLHLVSRLLPGPGHGQPAPGGQLRPAFSPPLFDRITTLGRAAARQFNQLAERPDGHPMEARPARPAQPGGS